MVTGLVWFDRTKNKRLRLNRLDTWWTVDWYGSIEQRTNVYALTGLALGGLWTGMVRTIPVHSPPSAKPVKAQTFVLCSKGSSTRLQSTLV